MTRMDVQEFDLRFDQRVLAFHVFVNTDRDHVPMLKQIQRAAKGSRLDASACWLEGYLDGREAWAEMIRERELSAPPALHAGNHQVLAIHLFVNTDADPYHIHKVILRIARGERLDPVVAWTEIYEGEAGCEIWAMCQGMAKRAAADPRSTSYSLRDGDR